MKPSGLIKAVGTVTLFSVFTRLLSFLFKIFLSRKVGAEVIGLYQIAVSVFYLFASIGCSGIPQVLSRRVAEDNALRQGRSGGLVSAALILGVLFSLTTAVACILLGDKLSFLFGDERAVTLFVIMAPAIVSTTIYSIIRAFFWGKKEFTYFSITETVEEILRIIFTAILVCNVFFYLENRIAIALAFTLSDVAVAFILVGLFIFKHGLPSRPKGFRDILLPSLPLTATRLMSGLSGTLMSIILPIALVKSGLSGSEATAKFGRITGMANPLLFAPNALISSIAVVMIPEMSESGVLGNNSKLNGNLNKAISFSIIISGVFVAVYSGVGSTLTELLFGDAESGRYLTVASLSMIPMGISSLISSSLNSVGLERASLIGFVASTAASFGIIIGLAPVIREYSVAVASFVSSLISVTVGSVALYRKVGYAPKYLRTLTCVTAFIIPTSFLAYSVNRVLYPYLGSMAVVVAGAISAILYSVFCVGFSLIDVRALYVKKSHSRS